MNFAGFCGHFLIIFSWIPCLFFKTAPERCGMICPSAGQVLTRLKGDMHHGKLHHRRYRTDPEEERYQLSGGRRLAGLSQRQRCPRPGRPGAQRPHQARKPAKGLRFLLRGQPPQPRRPQPPVLQVLPLPPEGEEGRHRDCQPFPALLPSGADDQPPSGHHRGHPDPGAGLPRVL